MCMSAELKFKSQPFRSPGSSPPSPRSPVRSPSMASPQTPVTPPNQVKISFEHDGLSKKLSLSFVRLYKQSCFMQWPHVPTTTVPGWQGEAFTHNKQVEISCQQFFPSLITSEILAQINGRRHQQVTLFIFLAFFSNWNFQVGAPLAPPTSCLKVRHMFDLQHQVATKIGKRAIIKKLY